MIIIEEVIHYNKDSLYDLIKNKEDINDFTVQLLCNFVDDMSIRLAEIDSQLNRLPLALSVHKQYNDIKNNFAQLILDLLELEITETYKDRLLDNYLSSVYNYIDSLTSLLPSSINKSLDVCYDEMSVIIQKFKTESQGIVDTFENNDEFTINNNTDIDDNFNLSYFNNKTKHNNVNTVNKNKNNKKIKKYMLRKR